MVLEIVNRGNHHWGTTDIVGNQKNVFDFFGWRISRTMGDGLFSKRCDTDVSWTHVTIATDAVICTRPSLLLDSKDLKLPLRYRLLFLDMTFQQTFPYITLRPLLPESQFNRKTFTRVVGILPHRLHSLRPGLLLETLSHVLMLLILLLLRTIGPWVLPPLISCSLAQNPSESVCQYCAILTFARRSKGWDYSMSVLSTLILQFDSINFEYSRIFRRYI